MTPDEQLEKWVAGNPIHNNTREFGGRVLQGGECCPDFSCCHAQLLAPLEEREKFRDNPKARPQMLMNFLSRFLESQGHKVMTSGGIK